MDLLFITLEIIYKIKGHYFLWFSIIRELIFFLRMHLVYFEVLYVSFMILRIYEMSKSSPLEYINNINYKGIPILCISIYTN
jgi:hypothetical protein